MNSIIDSQIEFKRCIEQVKIKTGEDEFAKYFTIKLNNNLISDILIKQEKPLTNSFPLHFLLDSVEHEIN